MTVQARKLSAPRRLKYSWILAVITLSILAWIAGSELRSIDWHGVSRAWLALPPWWIATSLGCSLISFSMLGLFDVLAARCVAPHRVSAKRAAFAGVVSNAFSNTLGFPALTGSVIRYRIYASSGLGAGDIARIVALAAFGIAMGFTVVAPLANGP